MSLHTGYIREIIERAWKNKTFYSIKLHNGDMIGFGSYPPKMKENDYIQVEAEENDKGYLNAVKGTFKILPAPTESVSNGKSAAAAASEGGVKSSTEYWAAKDARDVRNDRLREVGASRNTAIEWIKFLVDKGGLPLPKKQAEVEDALNQLLDGYTKTFMTKAESFTNGDESSEGSKQEEDRGSAEGAASPDGDWN
jgi:hypothetical protein